MVLGRPTYPKLNTQAQTSARGAGRVPSQRKPCIPPRLLDDTFCEKPKQNLKRQTLYCQAVTILRVPGLDQFAVGDDVRVRQTGTLGGAGRVPSQRKPFIPSLTCSQIL